MNTIYAKYNMYHNSIDIYTSAFHKYSNPTTSLFIPPLPPPYPYN